MNRLLSLTLMCAIAVTSCQVFGTEEHRDASEPCACACCCPCECQQTPCAPHTDSQPAAHKPSNDAALASVAFLSLGTVGTLAVENSDKIEALVARTAQTVTQQCAKVKDQAVGLVNSVKEKCLPLVHNVLNHERVQAALAYARNTTNQATTYAKENPVKTALITVGASVVAATAYALVRGARHAYRRYQAYHNCYCVCCGKKIGSREQKYATNNGYYYGWKKYYCEKCHKHIELHVDNNYSTRRALLDS